MVQNAVKKIVFFDTNWTQYVRIGIIKKIQPGRWRGPIAKSPRYLLAKRVRRKRGQNPQKFSYVGWPHVMAAIEASWCHQIGTSCSSLQSQVHCQSSWSLIQSSRHTCCTGWGSFKLHWFHTVYGCLCTYQQHQQWKGTHSLVVVPVVATFVAGLHCHGWKMAGLEQYLKLGVCPLGYTRWLKSTAWDDWMHC